MNVQEIIYANEIDKYKAHLWRLRVEVSKDEYLQPTSRDDLESTLQSVYEQLGELSKRLLCATQQS